MPKVGEAAFYGWQKGKTYLLSLESVEQARSEIFSYIEGYYNRIGRHSSLGYLSPLEFEKQLKIKNGGMKESFISCFS